MDAARAEADAAKAPVAVKDDYRKASAVADRAMAEKKAGNIAAAATDFPQATGMFTAAAERARQKRAAAQAAIDAANASGETAKKTAEDADSTLKTEGFAESTQGGAQ